MVSKSLKNLKIQLYQAGKLDGIPRSLLSDWSLGDLGLKNAPSSAGCDLCTVKFYLVKDRHFIVREQKLIQKYKLKIQNSAPQFLAFDYAGLNVCHFFNK